MTTEQAEGGPERRARIEFGSVQRPSSVLQTILECGLLLIGIRFAEMLFFKPGFFETLPFHPFWLVILLAALQYGVVGGVTAAAMASLLMDWPARPLGVDITQHFIQVVAQPLLWLGTALCIGAYRSLQLRESRRLREELARVAHVNETLADELERIDSALSNAELEIATRAKPQEGEDSFANAVVELFEAQSDVDDVADMFKAAVAAATPLSSRLFWVVNGPDSRGFTDLTNRNGGEVLAFDNKLVRQIISKRRALVSPGCYIDGNDTGFAAAAGVFGVDGIELRGIVVLLAEEKKAAREVLPVARLLALATGTALWSEAVDIEPRDGNVVAIRNSDT